MGSWHHNLPNTLTFVIRIPTAHNSRQDILPYETYRIHYEIQRSLVTHMILLQSLFVSQNNCISHTDIKHVPVKSVSSPNHFYQLSIKKFDRRLILRIPRSDTRVPIQTQIKFETLCDNYAHTTLDDNIEIFKHYVTIIIAGRKTVAMPRPE